jgi:hypothetical protein
MILPRNRSTRQAAVEAVRQRGGTVVFGPSGKSGLAQDVISVDLSRAVVDAELMQTLGQFTGIVRLNLDGARLRSQDWALLGKLPRLQNLSLSRSNVTDAGLSQLSLRLESLSLNGTSITDKSMSTLAAMNGLVNLDITDTGITSDGLQLLEPLALKTLHLDDACIAVESVRSLQRMQPQNIKVAVSEGMGRRAHELLSVCKRPNIKGHHRDGYVLWAADLAWNQTLAGVVEAVVSEIGLDPQQATQLLTALANSAQQYWGTSMPGPLPPVKSFSHSTALADRGMEIESTNEFIGELQKDSIDIYAVRRFAREKFTAGDVPKLLAAIRAAQESEHEKHHYLFCYGTFLLVQHGIDDPDVGAQLDRMLASHYHFVSCSTRCAFGYGGAMPFYSREEWSASETADAWIVPRLLRTCRDKGRSDADRDGARLVLTEIALRRPEYAAEVLPVFVDLLDEEGPWQERLVGDPYQISRVAISRLANFDANAAIAVVPKLREMLKRLDEQFAGAPAASFEDRDALRNVLGRRRSTVLEALSATAHQNPELAHQIALEYLSRMERGQPAGPFAPLLSPATPDANRMVVIALLNKENTANGQFPSQPPYGDLVDLANRIRDWRTTKGKQNE